jgi:hypothetical protein
LQAGLSFDLLAFMQPMIASTFGMWLEQRRNASGVQARRCSAVASIACAAKEVSEIATAVATLRTRMVLMIVFMAVLLVVGAHGEPPCSWTGGCPGSGPDTVMRLTLD